MSHYHDCPQCYAHVPCTDVCSVEPDTGAGHHLVCDVCDATHKEEEDRAATIEAAARKLLEALPRCGCCGQLPTKTTANCKYQACDYHAQFGSRETPILWADAARELEKALEEKR